MRAKSILLIVVLTVLAVGMRASAGYQGINMISEWYTLRKTYCWYGSEVMRFFDWNWLPQEWVFLNPDTGEFEIRWQEGGGGSFTTGIWQGEWTILDVGPTGPKSLLVEMLTESHGPLNDGFGSFLQTAPFHVSASGGGSDSYSAGAGARFRFTPWPDTSVFEFELYTALWMPEIHSLGFVFTDITSGDVLVDFRGIGPDTEIIGSDTWITRRTYSFQADPSHVYEMDLGTGGAFSGLVDVTWLQPHVVPAPGAILLGMLGTGLVGWLRRHRRL